MAKAVPSLRTIAALTGYSLGTVSMALRGDTRIAGQTRELILRTAGEHGYLPDPLLAGRMNQVRRRSKERRSPVKLAHLIAWRRAESYYEFGPFRDFREGAARRAGEFGYELEDFLLDDTNMHADRLNNILRTRAVPGVLIAPVQRPVTDRLALGLGWPGLEFSAYSTIGYTLDVPAVSRAVHDHAGAVELACARLAERGCRRIALALGEVMHRRVHGRWLAGWVCAQADIYQAPRPLVAADMQDEARFDRWLERERPDAIVTCDWDGVARHCARLGLRPGRDIGLVDLQWSVEGERRAGVDQANLEVGAAAVDIILAQINRHERGDPAIPKTVLVPGRWMDGPTVSGG